RLAAAFGAELKVLDQFGAQLHVVGGIQVRGAADVRQGVVVGERKRERAGDAQRRRGAAAAKVFRLDARLAQSDAECRGQLAEGVAKYGGAQLGDRVFILHVGALQAGRGTCLVGRVNASQHAEGREVGVQYLRRRQREALAGRRRLEIDD